LRQRETNLIAVLEIDLETNVIAASDWETALGVSELSRIGMEKNLPMR